MIIIIVMIYILFFSLSLDRITRACTYKRMIRILIYILAFVLARANTSSSSRIGEISYTTPAGPRRLRRAHVGRPRCVTPGGSYTRARRDRSGTVAAAAAAAAKPVDLALSVRVAAAAAAISRVCT